MTSYEVTIVLNRNDDDGHIYLVTDEKIDGTSYLKESYDLSMMLGKNESEAIFEESRINYDILQNLYNKYFCRNNNYLYIDDPKAKEKIKRAMIENINKNIMANLETQVKTYKGGKNNE